MKKCLMTIVLTLLCVAGSGKNEAQHFSGGFTEKNVNGYYNLSSELALPTYENYQPFQDLYPNEISNGPAKAYGGPGLWEDSDDLLQPVPIGDGSLLLLIFALGYFVRKQKKTSLR